MTIDSDFEFLYQPPPPLQQQQQQQRRRRRQQQQQLLNQYENIHIQQHYSHGNP